MNREKLLNHSLIVHCCTVRNDTNFSNHLQFSSAILVPFGVPDHQCDQKKSPNVYKTCPKMIFVEK